MKHECLTPNLMALELRDMLLITKMSACMWCQPGVFRGSLFIIEVIQPNTILLFDYRWWMSMMSTHCTVGRSIIEKLVIFCHQYGWCLLIGLLMHMGLLCTEHYWCRHHSSCSSFCSGRIVPMKRYRSAPRSQTQELQSKPSIPLPTSTQTRLLTYITTQTPALRTALLKLVLVTHILQWTTMTNIPPTQLSITHQDFQTTLAILQSTTHSSPEKGFSRFSPHLFLRFLFYPKQTFRNYRIPCIVYSNW